MRGKWVLVACAAILVVLAATYVAAQDFQKSYSLGTGGKVLIRNISGDVRITGYEGDRIMVVATREGKDKDKVTVEDVSAGDKVDLKVKYPENCNCDASIHFEVRVPSRIDYSFETLASVSGNVEISKVRGNIRASSVSGNVSLIDVTGIVNASSVSGNVDAQITQFSGAGDMKFNSVSGNVNVKAPLNTDANVEMSSVSGALDTDFPLEIEEKSMGPGSHARGRLGGGNSRLRISTVSGKVSFVRN